MAMTRRGFPGVLVRSSSQDWSPVEFSRGPTPGHIDAVAGWMKELRSRSESLRQRAESMDEVLGVVGAPFWSGLAADAFRARLRVTRDATTAASIRHGEAGDATQAWAESMFHTQFAADNALQHAEEAQYDLAVAEAAVTALSGDHSGLLSTLAALERTYSRYAAAPPPSGVHVPTGLE